MSCPRLQFPAESVPEAAIERHSGFASVGVLRLGLISNIEQQREYRGHPQRGTSLQTSAVRGTYGDSRRAPNEDCESGPAAVNLRVLAWAVSSTQGVRQGAVPVRPFQEQAVSIRHYRLDEYLFNSETSFRAGLGMGSSLSMMSRFSSALP